jgi:hypothetical protein
MHGNCSTHGMATVQRMAWQLFNAWHGNCSTHGMAAGQRMVRQLVYTPAAWYATPPGTPSKSLISSFAITWFHLHVFCM